MHCFGDAMAMAKANTDFRHVCHTNDAMQMAFMNIEKSTHIGMEKHAQSSQFVFIVKGRGILTIDGKKEKLKPGVGAMIPPGASHDIRGTTKDGLRLFTIYAPPVHPDGLVQKTNPMPQKVRKSRAAASPKAAVAKPAAKAASPKRSPSPSKSPAKKTAKPAAKKPAKAAKPAAASPKAASPKRSPSPSKSPAKKTAKAPAKKTAKAPAKKSTPKSKSRK